MDMLSASLSISFYIAFVFFIIVLSLSLSLSLAIAGQQAGHWISQLDSPQPPGDTVIKLTISHT